MSVDKRTPVKKSTSVDKNASIENLITDHIDIWTSAIKQKSATGRGSNKKRELYGIRKLRELILELAVRGKLVPQDPNDEPASVLLERIAEEKAQLVKDKKIKKPKKLPEITEDEKPFDFPKSWEICRLGDAINVLNGRAYKKHEMLQEGVPILRVGNLFTSNEWYYSDLELEPEKYIDNGDLIYSWSASFGPFIWTGGKVIYHYHIWKMDIYDDRSLDKFFANKYLESISASIKASGNGIAMIHMTKERMEKLVIPIPPISEQHRIVAKVDELMALCDDLEAQTESSLDAHQTLVTVLLDTLVNSQNADELAENWARFSDHFDTLFTTEHSIDQLKQTVLQLAVMGKLVQQDPNDEPASVLLERIAAEKEQLIKDKKIKKQKTLPPISEDEKPFQLPKGWEWVCLSNIGVFTGGKTPSKANTSFWGGNIPWVTPKDMKVSLIYDSEDHVTQLAIDDGLAEISKDSILIVARSGILRRKLPVAITKTICTVNQDLKVLALLDTSMANYVALMLKGFESYILSNLTKIGTTVESLMFDEFSKHYFMLPPLEEQHRIVAKVDELMALCDQLKARLNDAQTTQLQLADALTEQAL